MYFVVIKQSRSNVKNPFSAELLLEEEAEAHGYANGYAKYDADPTILVMEYGTLDGALDEIIVVLSGNQSQDDEEQIRSRYRREIIRREIEVETRLPLSSANVYATVPERKKKKRWPVVVSAMLVLFLVSVIVTPDHGADFPIDDLNIPAASADNIAIDPYESVAGDSIEVEPGLYLKVNGARVANGGVFEADGAYLILDCTYENKSKDEAYLSTLINLSVKDADGYKYGAAFGALTKGSLDGALAAGDILRGEVAFDVPDGAVVEYFCYDPFLVSGYGQAKWKIDVNVRAE